LIACERTGRVCRRIEIDRLYGDTAIRRWQKYTGEEAANGSTFDNRGNLADRFLESIRRKYEGTRLGRQELNA
jgi:DNA modification methylase